MGSLAIQSWEEEFRRNLDFFSELACIWLLAPRGMGWGSQIGGTLTSSFVPCCTLGIFLVYPGDATGSALAGDFRGPWDPQNNYILDMLRGLT